MRLSFMILLLFYDVVHAAKRRGYSVGSQLLRYILSKTKYNNSNAEYGRVTQAPIVKVQLHKTFLPRIMHAPQKEPMAEILLQRASELEHENQQLGDSIDEADAAVSDLEGLEELPLPMFNARDYTEKEYTSKFGKPTFGVLI